MAARRGRVSVSITGDNAGLKKTVAESEGQLAKLNSAVSKHGKTLATAAKAAVGLSAGYAAITDAKAAVDTTTELAHATLVLHRNLGLSVKSASEFAGVAKVRGIETKALTQSFGTLSKQFVSLEGGSKKTVDAFKTLGITQKDIAGKPFERQLGVVADAFGKMHGGSQRAALGMQLFGRGWQTVLPLMSQGKKGLQDQLALADKYGVTLGGKTVKNLEGLIRAQRESKFATLGLQVAFGTVLAPAMTKGITAVNKFVLGMRDGTGAGGRFADAMKPIASVLKTVAKLLGDHPKLIAGAVAAWGLYKSAGVVATAVTRGKIIASFLGLGAKAAAGGAEAGGAFGTAASTSAGSKMRGFNWKSLGRGIGVLLGVEIASQIAQAIHAENADPLLLLHPPSAGGKQRSDGTFQDTIPKNHRVPKVNQATSGRSPDHFPSLTKKPPSIPKGVSGHRAGARAHAAIFSPGGATAHTAGVSGQRLSGQQIAQVWLSAGGSPAAVDTAVAVALAESGGYTAAENTNTDGSVDRGLWQINSVHGAQSTFDVAGNARAAVAISGNGSNWGAWVTYNTGAYRQHLGQAGSGASTGTGGTFAAATGGGSSKGKSLVATLGHTVKAVPGKRGTSSLKGSIYYSPPSDQQLADLTGDPQTNEVSKTMRLFQIGVRINTIKNALRRPLTPATSKRLLDELGQLQQEATGLQAPASSAAPATGVDAIPGATGYLSSINKDSALAALTPDTGDDVAAATKLVGARQDILTYEQGHGFSDDDVAQAASDLKAARDSLDQLQTSVQQVADNTQAQLDLMTQARDEAQRALNVSQNQYGVLAKAISDIANGGIGGRLGLGFQTPSFAGGVAKA